MTNYENEYIISEECKNNCTLNLFEFINFFKIRLLSTGTREKDN